MIKNSKSTIQTPPPFSKERTLKNRVASHQPEYTLWLDCSLETVWSPDVSAARGALTELEALGTIQEAFPKCIPLQEQQKSQTPDFVVDGEFCAEAYCPRESTQNRDRVVEDLDRQTGMVRIAISHPHTGSAGESLRYPANKIILRFLNQKRASGEVRKDCAPMRFIRSHLRNLQKDQAGNSESQVSHSREISSTNSGNFAKGSSIIPHVISCP